MTNPKPIDTLAGAAHWYALLATGPLSAAEQYELQAWLAQNPDHADALKEATRIWDSFEVETLPTEFDVQRSAALSRLAASKRKNARQRTRRFWIPSAIAACLVLAVGMGGTVAFLKAREPVRYATAAGESRVVVLNDGSRVTLDADTAIKVQFRSNIRQVWLTKGRANFEVAGNPVRPFTVDATERTVVATGTEFTVEKMSAELRVVLYEGHVAIMAKKMLPNGPGSSVTGAESYTEATLEPGSTYVYSTIAKATRIAPLKKSDDLDWQKGILAFDKEPLPLAIERANRYSKDKIVLKDVKQKDIKVSGVFKAGDQAAFVDGVATFNGLKSRESKGGYTLSDH
ncbi:FecR domain-containing protein [Asticcacaulis sp. YBE204]|uniref:FecR family protein n=1 Tax=Asticcacaulis sp. YBE204 TaxID=1282363 RepID=UPI0003C3E1B1|nr:FecR domain-containing protein [Asticcacaulis sp. YBE204]ESQ79226.1 hypothetical protein AEYBE204_09460 [Asticcacaulis sp. YBE204]